MTYKKCPTCGVTKIRARFSKSTVTPDKRSISCTLCNEEKREARLQTKQRPNSSRSASYKWAGLDTYWYGHPDGRKAPTPREGRGSTVWRVERQGTVLDTLGTSTSTS